MSNVPQWLTALRDSMKPTFEAGSVQAADLKLIVGDMQHAWLRSLCLNPRMGFHPSIEREESIAMTGIAGWPQGAVVHLFGKQAYIARFRRAAHDAGALLPKEDDPGRTAEHFAAAWIAFVVNQLKTHPSNAIAVDDGSAESAGDELHVNPFTASLTALSSAIGRAETEQAEKQDAGPRISAIVDTQSVNLDGRIIFVPELPAFKLFAALVNAHNENRTPVTRRKLFADVGRKDRDGRVKAHFAALPGDLSKLIRSSQKPGGGYSLCLPTLAKK